MGLHDQKIDGVPQFVSYFGPILQIMRDLGGQAQPRQVFDELIARHEIPADFLALTNKNGGSKFENRVHFARFYLSKAGLMFAPKRGLWGLTEAGSKAEPTSEGAAEIFRNARTSFAGDEDEQQAPAEVVVPDSVAYWFVGSAWETADQTARSLKEGIWQNGYDEKFSKLVKQMKPGDRIAIKAAFVRKHGLPFESHGRPVSVMRVKAIGTITANQGDGQTVAVDRQELNPPRDWYFYTFRTTVVRARFEDDDMARQLVAFTFDGSEQDFGRFLAHPYWAERFAPEIDPFSALEADEDAEGETTAAPEIIPYGIDDIIADGGFMDRQVLSELVDRLGSRLITNR